MKTLVIGGTRFIGPHVVSRLIQLGNQVTVLHRGMTGVLPAGADEVLADRTEDGALCDAIRNIRPEVIVDMYCMTERDAHGLISACSGIARRIVVISSMDVYRSYGCFIRVESGEPDLTPSTEDSPLRSALYPYRSMSKSPDDLFYNYEKILVEQVAMSQAATPATVLRLPAVYGPGDHRCFDYAKRIADGRPAIVLGSTQANWRWTRGYVENVADAVALTVIDERSANRIYNVGETDALAERMWVESIARAAGWNGTVAELEDSSLPDHLKLPYDFRHHLIGNTTRIREELDYRERVTRETALKETVEWELEHQQAQFDASRFDYAVEDAILRNLAG